MLMIANECKITKVKDQSILQVDSDTMVIETDFNDKVGKDRLPCKIFVCLDSNAESSIAGRLDCKRIDLYRLLPKYKITILLEKHIF